MSPTWAARWFLTRPCRLAELSSHKLGADCSGKSLLPEDIHFESSKSDDTLLPTSARTCASWSMSTYNFFRKVLKSRTALVQQMSLPTHLDLSTALNKCYLEIADTFLHNFVRYCLSVVLFIFVRDNVGHLISFERSFCLFVIPVSFLFPCLVYLRNLFRDQEAVSSFS